MYDLIIRDGTIVQAGGRQVADIAIEDGRIAYVGENPAGGARTEVSAIGLFVLPGFIDVHVRYRGDAAPSTQAWARESAAAVVTGITTALEAPSGGWPICDAEAVAAVREAACESFVHVGMWIGATRQNRQVADNLWAAGEVCGAFVDLGAVDGPFALDEADFDDWYTHAQGLLGVRALDRSTLAERRAATVEGAHYNAHPVEAAVAAVEQLVARVKSSPRPLHLIGISTAGELNVLEPYRGELPITTEVHPGHLFISIETAGDTGPTFKIDPPVRPEFDRRALWSAIKRRRIDCFASDHVPVTRDQKQAGYADAPSGLPTVDAFYPLLMAAVTHGRLTLEHLVEMCAESPARIFGLKRKGRIAEGADADLLVCREEATARLKAKQIQSRAGWSPFVGREIGLPPELVIVGGRVVARAGKLVDDAPAAGALAFDRD